MSAETKAYALACAFLFCKESLMNKSGNGVVLFEQPNSHDTQAARCGFLLDMDGVIYRGEEPIPGARAFIHHLRERNTPFLFLTNNSASSPRDYQVKLRSLGIEVEESHFYTCAMAT